MGTSPAARASAAQPTSHRQHHHPTSSPLCVSGGSAYTPNERGGGVTTLTSKNPGFRALRSGLLRLPESCGLPPLLLLPGRSLARVTTVCVHRCWVVLLLVLGLQVGTCGVKGRRGPTERLCIFCWLCGHGQLRCCVVCSSAAAAAAAVAPRDMGLLR